MAMRPPMVFRITRNTNWLEVEETVFGLLCFYGRELTGVEDRIILGRMQHLVDQYRRSKVPTRGMYVSFREMERDELKWIAAQFQKWGSRFTVYYPDEHEDL